MEEVLVIYNVWHLLFSSAKLALSIQPVVRKKNKGSFSEKTKEPLPQSGSSKAKLGH
jgi:hypothetical protein